MVPDAVYVEFGRLVHGHRQRAGLTQSALGERVGLSRTSITNIEKGRQKVLLHQVFLLAVSMGVTPDALLPSLRATRPQLDLEKKLPNDLTGSQRAWVHRVMTSGEKQEDR